jgi:uncharacterized membrane protein HdeD (DUF308 family)
MSGGSSATFGVKSMGFLTKSILAGLGVVAMLAGVLLLLDGLLPVRSHGTNPSWLEVAVGLLIGVAGFVMRRMARRAPVNPSATL